MPNMTWVLGRRGQILYKAMWTSADRVAEFCARLRTEMPGHALFYTEQAEWRAHDMDGFMRLLERNGPRSVAEFQNAIKVWTERARRERREGR